MNEEQLNQVLEMTIDDMLVDSKTSMLRYNLLKIQLGEKEAENKRLQARVEELEALLDEQTKPAEEGE
ncbi:phage protein [Streptococcus pneumoniae]|nr:phage protein [Streptococcus pneumoniae]VSR37930.1 phage protein [Streptococcus pneumoniae]